MFLLNGRANCGELECIHEVCNREEAALTGGGGVTGRGRTCRPPARCSRWPVGAVARGPSMQVDRRGQDKWTENQPTISRRTIAARGGGRGI